MVEAIGSVGTSLAGSASGSSSRTSEKDDVGSVGASFEFSASGRSSKESEEG